MTDTILIIEDEPAIADTLIYPLEQDGFATKWVTTAQEARAFLAENTPTLILLDVGLPDENGFNLFRSLQQSTPIPCIFLTARSDEIDRVAGLEMGADDYITKPFSPREVVARVRAVLRRTQTIKAVPLAQSHPLFAPQNTATPQENSNFTLDTQRIAIHYRGVLLDLPRYEYGILKLLITTPQRVFSRSEIMDLVWEESDISGDRTVDTHIKTLRNKLKEITPEYDPIETRRGLGYALNEDQQAPQGAHNE